MAADPALPQNGGTRSPWGATPFQADGVFSNVSDFHTDGAVTYAHGTRVLVRLDAGTLSPAPWSEEFRAAGRELLRPAD